MAFNKVPAPVSVAISYFWGSSGRCSLAATGRHQLNYRIPVSTHRFWAASSEQCPGWDIKSKDSGLARLLLPRRCLSDANMPRQTGNITNTRISGVTNQSGVSVTSCSYSETMAAAESDSKGSEWWFVATSALESLGDSITRNLLPIIAVSSLAASTAFVGLLNSVGLIAFMVLSLPLGVLADRWSAPGVMMAASTPTRAGIAVLGVALWALGILSGKVGLILLLALASIIGIADVVFAAGQGLLVPRMVRQDRIRAVFGRAQSANQAGGAIGPVLLTAMLAVVAAPVAWISAALAYLGSVAAQARIRTTIEQPEAGTENSLWAGAKHGLKHLWQQPTLRWITAGNALTNAAAMCGNTLLPVVVIANYGLSAGIYAALGGVGALAGVAGALWANRIVTGLGLYRTRLAVSAAQLAGFLGVAVTGIVATMLPGPTLAWLMVQSATAGAGVSMAMVAGSDLPAKLTPVEALGSVMGAQRLVVIGVMPIAALLVGAIGAMSLIAAAYVWGALLLASLVSTLGLRSNDPS